MNKTITIITGGIVTIALSIFLILGKIDLATFSTSATAILGVIYGFYTKVENKELKETVDVLKDNELAQKRRITYLEKDNGFLLNSLKKEVESTITSKSKNTKTKPVVESKTK